MITPAGPRARRLVLRRRRRRHVRGLGRRRRAATRSIPAGPSISGYSMGGYGTYKLAAQFPDLFARANPVVGPPSRGVSVPGDRLRQRRHGHQPDARLAAAGPVHDLGRGRGRAGPDRRGDRAGDNFDDLGLPLRLRRLPHRRPPPARRQRPVPPAADFLGTARVRPQSAARQLRPQPDHGLPRPGDGRPTTPTGSPACACATPSARRRSARSTRSRTRFGEGDPQPGPTQTRSAVLPPGDLGLPFPYNERSKSWGPTPEAPRRDRLELELENVSRVVVDTKRAQLTCDAADRRRHRRSGDGEARGLRQAAKLRLSTGRRAHRPSSLRRRWTSSSQAARASASPSPSAPSPAPRPAGGRSASSSSSPR